jgi:hypothetical protein
MIPRFRVSPVMETDQSADAWGTLSLTAEEVPGHPVQVAMFLLPGYLAEEFTRQMMLLNDVLDVEDGRT